jgi:prefoldin subunit 5
MDISNILSGIAVLLAASLVAWMKVVSARAFKSLDDKVKELHTVTVNLDLAVREVEKGIVQFREFEKSVDKDIKHVKADLSREAQVMNNHLDSVHKKIDHIDSILDKLREK